MGLSLVLLLQVRWMMGRGKEVLLLQVRVRPLPPPPLGGMHAYELLLPPLVLQALYVVDSIFNESSILTTMDITVRAGGGAGTAAAAAAAAAVGDGALCRESGSRSECKQVRRNLPSAVQDDGFGFMLCFGELRYCAAPWQRGAS